MKKIKTIFYGVYLVYIAFGMFIGLFYENLVLRWDWDWIDTWVGLIRFVMKMGAFGIMILITQMVLENIIIRLKSKQILNLGDQITELKAKLYDQSEQVQEDLSKNIDVTSNENDDSNTKS